MNLDAQFWRSKTATLLPSENKSKQRSHQSEMSFSQPVKKTDHPAHIKCQDFESNCLRVLRSMRSCDKTEEKCRGQGVNSTSEICFNFSAKHPHEEELWNVKLIYG